MARDILAIQAAGVGIEREFSIARNFNQDNRTYSAAVLGALMVCNHHQSEENFIAKRDFYIQLRVEEVSPEELVAEEEQDTLATDAVAKGLVEIYISDDDERDSEDEDKEAEAQASHSSPREPAPAPPRRVTNALPKASAITRLRRKEA